MATLNLMAEPDGALSEVGRADGQERPLRRTPAVCVLGRQGGLSDRLPTRVEVATGLLRGSERSVAAGMGAQAHRQHLGVVPISVLF